MYTPKLLELFSAKGGAAGQRIKNLLMELYGGEKDPSASTVKKRDATLRFLIEYLGESGLELISDYYATAETSVHEDLRMHSMTIYVCHEPDAVGIIIDRIPVLADLFVGLNTLRPKPIPKFMSFKNKLQCRQLCTY